MDPLWLLLIPLGLVSGVLTTIAGLGGGMLLVVILGAAVDPRFALAVTAPALLVGNSHRAWLFRQAIDRRLARSFVAGAVPGSLVGGFFAVAVPELVLHLATLAVTVLAIARVAGIVQWTPSTTQIVPASAGIAVVNATAGGAGVLISPLMMASGLRGEAYVATSAVVAVSMHVVRTVAYGVGGMITAETVAAAALVAVCLLAGNVLGKRLRAHLTEKANLRIEVGVLVVATLVALGGALR